MVNDSLKVRIPWNKGKPMSLESKLKISISKKNIPSPKKGIKSNIHPKSEFKKGFIPWNKGIKTGMKPWNYIDGRSLHHHSKGNGRPKGEKHWRWRGGEEKGFSKHNNSSSWKRIRLLILSRDKNTCRICGKLGYEVHHIIPYRYSKSDEPKNLITVCRPCHVSLENKVRKEYN